MKLVLDILTKYRLYINHKNCQSHKDKICFLDYIISAQEVVLKDK